MLKQIFINLNSHYIANSKLAVEFWDEIESAHSNPKRYYHTLLHLENIYKQLAEIKPLIKSWETVLFSLFYHDVVYNTLKSNNEERSADFAEKRLKKIEVPIEIIENCKQQILATKNHIKSKDTDTNYFTDADLSILGQDWDAYKTYLNNVRKEYKIYPNVIYKRGRKKVIQYFLEKDNIYKTEHFFDKFETQAKNNLARELDLLKKKNLLPS